MNFTVTQEDKLKYTGSVIVEVTRKSGKKEIYNSHNEAKTELLNAIVKLLGNKNCMNLIPSSIMLCYKNGDDIKDCLTARASRSTSAAYYQKVIEGTTTTYTRIDDSTYDANTVQYSFTIPQTQIKTTMTTSNFARLYNSRDEICADTDLSSAISLQNVSNITVYWRLNVSDAASSN